MHCNSCPLSPLSENEQSVNDPKSHLAGEEVEVSSLHPLGDACQEWKAGSGVAASVLLWSTITHLYHIIPDY